MDSGPFGCLRCPLDTDADGAPSFVVSALAAEVVGEFDGMPREMIADLRMKGGRKAWLCRESRLEGTEGGDVVVERKRLSDPFEQDAMLTQILDQSPSLCCNLIQILTPMSRPCDRVETWEVLGWEGLMEQRGFVIAHGIWTTVPGSVLRLGSDLVHLRFSRLLMGVGMMLELSTGREVEKVIERERGGTGDVVETETALMTRMVEDWG